MKCVKCGAELKEGCIYCSVCGNEAQIVPDYSVLEDDYLRSLLKEEEERSQEKQSKSRRDEKDGEKNLRKKKKMDNRIPVIVVCILLAACIIIGIIVKVVINHKNANSYEYQVKSAKEEYRDKNYENALSYYKTALSLKPDDVAVRLAMSEIYMELEEYDSAMVLLVEVIDLEPQNLEAYKNLINIYAEKEDYESIANLATGVDDSKILKLFEGYLVDEPMISPIEGEYDEYIDVELTSTDNFDIYYTLDGTTPDRENGILYSSGKDEGISLHEAGKYTVRAVCINEKGISSAIAEATYDIEVAPPEFAIVFPDGGRITSETKVTIEAEEDCSIYYTWDGTDPTDTSLKYVEPLDIPTGNKILSVLVVNDKTGLDSGVYRTNFIYYP